MTFYDRLAQVVSMSPEPELHSGASGYFDAPQKELDPHLFTGTEIKPDVRKWLVDTLYTFWDTKFRAASEWSTVWIAGSGITYQWAGNRGNGDLDVLIGIDFVDFFRHNPDYLGFSSKEMGNIINTQLKAELWPRTDLTNINLNGQMWVENGSLPKNQINSYDYTMKGKASIQSPNNLALPRTQSRNIFETMAAKSETININGTPPKYVHDVTSHPSIYVENVNPAKRERIENSITSENTESVSMNTNNFWRNKISVARSADQGTQKSLPDSKSITVTKLEGLEAYSVSPVTKVSDISAIPANLSNAPSSMLEAENVQTYSVTFYVNPESASILDINPYAAYNLTTNHWDVTPPELPDDPATLYSPDFYKEADKDKDAAARFVKEYRTLRNTLAVAQQGTAGWASAVAQINLVVSQAKDLFDSIHLGRRLAFQSGGSGYGDYYNFRWQVGKQNGTVASLREIAGTKKTADEENQTDLYGVPIMSAEDALIKAALWRRKR